MKRAGTLLLFVLVCAMILAAAPALASGASPFSFRNGICFGMSAQEIIQLEAANGQVDTDAWETTDMSGQQPGLSLLLSQTQVKVSTYDAVVGYFLTNDQMQGAAYEFPVCTDAMAQDLAAALNTVYGVSQTVSFDTLVQDLQRIVPTAYDNAPAAHDVLVWQPDNVTVYMYYYTADMFGILYLNPGPDASPAVNTTGL